MRGVRGLLLGCAAAVLISGCGSGTVAPTPPPRTATPAPTPTPTPTPAPDIQRIDVLTSGFGLWQLVTVPVAVIHNAAARSMVSGLLVQLTPTRAGHPLTTTVTPALTLYPGQTLVVAGNCTDTCTGATGVAVAVTAGTWAAVSGAPLTATAGAPTCVVSCHSHGQWDVPATVGGAGLVQNEVVDIFASCANAAGTVIGGGQRTLLWPQAGGTLDLHVPVIVNSPPASCQVGATISN
jgi:hypothetical protein